MSLRKLLATTTSVILIVSISVSAFAIGAGFNSGESKSNSTPKTNTTSKASSDSQKNELGYTRTELDEDAIIENGVYSGPVSLGGMTPGQARVALTDFCDEVMKSTLTFQKTKSAHNTTLNELGYSYDKEGTVQQAALLGKYGPLIDRYKLLTDLKYDKVNIPVKYSPNETALDTYMEKVVSSDDNPAKDATIKRSGNGFVTTHESSGEITDIEATKETLATTLKDSPSVGMSINVSTKGDEPRIKESDLTEIKDTLGTYKTSYAGSTADRKTNVKVATDNINGYVILPGETISVSNTMKERNAENGYAMATEYVGTESVDSYGGGVCQVATTLYNAALNAELKINQRSNHSMLVGYVDPSFDAAISWGNLDLVLENNTGHTLFIEGNADGSNLSFTIYGVETRDANRTIQYESVIEERIPSETKTIYDPTKPKDFEESKGSNHDYCKSHLVKKVFVNGKQVEEVKFATDVYKASQKVVTKGSKEEEPEEPETQAPSPDDPDVPVTPPEGEN